MVSRRGALAAGVGVVAGLAASGCGAGEASNVKWAEPGSGMPGEPGAGIDVTIAPAAQATGVSPLEQVLVIMDGGTLQGVTVAAKGSSVTGAVGDDKRSWRSSGRLAYGKTYTVTVTATDESGKPFERKSTFTTLKPSATAGVAFQANALVGLKKGGTYGVGQPVIVRFSKKIKDRAAAEQAMQVVTAPAVEGRWRWINGQTAHWRPATYWASGTKITVQVNVFGVDLGGGVYGRTNATTNFTIGTSRIAIADAKTHYMKVYINGRMVRSIPISMGKGGTSTTPDGRTVSYWTNSGPHVVLTKSPTVRMRSASFGITDPKDPNFYDETIKLCCRVSYSGEFVHLADWNISAHGHANTSHGCINVGPSNAQWFYNTFQLGDVVEVRNTPRKLAVDNGLGDWTVPWAEW